MSVDACDSFVNQSGRIRRTSGLIRDTFFAGNYLGCDSIHIWNVTIYKSKESNSSLSACDSAEVNGNWYWATQMVHDTFMSSAGCDSVHHTDLTIWKSGIGLVDTTVCERYLSPAGNLYSSSGLYFDTLDNQSSKGCDSIIEINLIVNSASLEKKTITECDSFVSESGVIYKQSGLYTEGFTNSNGCDSIIEYDLTIFYAGTIDLDVEACDSVEINGQWFLEDTIAVFSYTNTNGCDSTERHSIQITRIDTAVSWDGTRYTAAQEGASYQWIDCSDNSEIDGETSRSFEPRKNGEYKVRIGLNDCEESGSCRTVSHFLSTDDLTIAEGVVAYPNPGNGSYTLVSERSLMYSLRITDLEGREVLNVPIHPTYETAFNIDVPGGTYIVEVQTDAGLVRILIVQN